MKTFQPMITAAMAVLTLCACAGKPTGEGDFVTCEGTSMLLGGRPYTFVGTNFWYGPILGSEGQGGDRGRLCRELDALHAMGLDNLRILVGADGPDNSPYKIRPTLQTAPGIYNDTLLAGLDFLLQQMQQRKMKAVLYLNNSWEWSGGYGYYLEQAGCGPCPMPADGYREYCQHVAQFATNQRAQQLFFDHVRFILSRTNRYTGLPYASDPTIMAWQVGNEPRAFSRSAKPFFAQWLRQASALIRGLDPNHLISVGSEGLYGCEADTLLLREVMGDENIDYITAHVWPANWGWANKTAPEQDLLAACDSSARYLSLHTALARQLHKPLVVEEFGFPRDGYQFSPQSGTRARDAYYDFMFNACRDEPCIAGINFWAWGGEARPQHEWWQPGDPYCGDPAQEPQGLYAVFATDTTTLGVISNYSHQPK